MKTNYESPKIEVIEIEFEDAVFTDSLETDETFEVAGPGITLGTVR